MKILHVDTETSWRGGERQALELAVRLNSRGIGNTVACRKGSELSERAVKAGVEVLHCPLLGELDILSAMRLRSFVTGRGVDIVHAHSSHAHGIALLALLGNRSCRLVVSRRVDFHVTSRFSRKVKYGNRVDRIITVSDAIGRILVEVGIDPDKIITIRSGFVPGEFNTGSPKSDLRSELNIPGDAVVIAVVAALAPHKDHDMLIRAASRVVRKHPGTVFLLAGKGELKVDLEKQIRHLGLEKSVKLLGFVQDIGAVYRAADVFALSSREEGLCTSNLDAMYFSLPIVATDAGGIPELVNDGVNGYLVPVGDDCAFAGRLNHLIEHPGIRRTLGSASSSILEDNGVDRTVDRTLGVYRELLNQ